MKMQSSLRNTLSLAVFLATLISTGTALACDGAGPSTHIGQLMSLDKNNQTFTILDAQSRSNITFTANNDIIQGLQGFSGNLMVNYQESENGLTAVGVTF